MQFPGGRLKIKYRHREGPSAGRVSTAYGGTRPGAGRGEYEEEEEEVVEEKSLSVTKTEFFAAYSALTQRRASLNVAATENPASQ